MSLLAKRLTQAVRVVDAARAYLVARENEPDGEYASLLPLFEAVQEFDNMDGELLK